MSKSTTANTPSKTSNDRGSSSHPGNGGNWPSTTGNTSGNGRGNAAPKGK